MNPCNNRIVILAFLLYLVQNAASIPLEHSFEEQNLLDKIGNSASRQATNCTQIHTLDLAIAYDNTYCALHRNNTATADQSVRSIVSSVNRVFETYTCVNISLGHVESHCNDTDDPYSDFTNFTNIGPSEKEEAVIASRFRTYWENSRGMVTRDLAILLLDKQLTSGVTGYAYTSGTCGNNGYGWVGKDFIPLLAHELGHSLSARHATSGLMQAAVPLNDRSFASSSVMAINNFANSASASCLATSSV